jgi:hypothetical protein
LRNGALLAVLAAVAASAQAQDAISPLELRSSFNETAWAVAPIHSREQLDDYMAKYDSPNNPLLWLSPDARRRFLQHAEFGYGRLVTIYYDDVEAELTLSQAYRLAALFGQQFIIATNVPDIRVVTEEDRIVDAWRQAYVRAERPSKP